jgi:DNA-binding FadR family transcriptional regulator
MRDTIIDDPAKLGTEEQFVYNKEFHSAVVDSTGNTLLSIAVQPIFSVLQTNFSRGAMSEVFAKRVNEDHRAILAAIEAGDSDAAAKSMQDHLDYLSDTYQQIWRRHEPPAEG